MNQSFVARAQSPAAEALRQRAEQLAAPLPPLMTAAERVAATVAQGVHGRRRVGTGETFWQFRRYQPGDPSQAIDWRRSAKSDRIYIRQNEWEAAQSLWLWCDQSPSMQYRSSVVDVDKRERACLITLALASLLVRGGERIALMGGEGRPSTGRAALDRLTAQLLDGRRSDETDSLPPPTRIPRHAQVVLISDFLAPPAEMEARIRGYAAHGVRGHLLQVLDPSEEDLPFSGRISFDGPEGEGELTVGRAEALREAYRDRLAALRDSLTLTTRRLGWTLACHRTDHPPQTALLALYGAVAHQAVVT